MMVLGAAVDPRTKWNHSVKLLDLIDVRLTLNYSLSVVYCDFKTFLFVLLTRCAPCTLR